MALRLFAAPLVLVVVVSAACGQRAPRPSTEEELEPSSVTRWTEKTELFAEYPPLVVGHTSRFAIHLTRLDSFEPLGEGSVEVRLKGNGVPDEVFASDGPSQPGIYGVDVTPTRAATRDLVVVLRSPTLHDQHDVGSVVVHGTEAEARPATAPTDDGAEGISFLKEQQWTLDFGTALVREQALRETLRVPAQIVARPGGTADVVAPFDGRLVRALDGPPGTTVTKGQELARVLPALSAPAGLPLLQQAHAEARSELDLAIRDRERAERLVTAGAAPQKRLEEAETTQRKARARLKGSEDRLAQYNAARGAGVDTDPNGLFLMHSPISGVIAQREATTGAHVSGGGLLFRIVDVQRVHVVGQVPEQDVARARVASGAELEIPGRPSRVPAGRFTSIGRVLDPQTRTVPITFTVERERLGLPVGQSVSLHLLLDAATPYPVVPASAVVEDGGRPILFVQRDGETFDRRPVTLGIRTGDLVQILDGVSRGERVVTRGAHLIRLASLSPEAPAHGHVH